MFLKDTYHKEKVKILSILTSNSANTPLHTRGVQVTETVTSKGAKLEI